MGTWLQLPKGRAETSNRGMDIQRKSLTRSAAVRPGWSRRPELVVDLEEGAAAAASLHGSAPLRVALGDGWVPPCSERIRTVRCFPFSREKKRTRRCVRRCLAPPRPWILTVSLEGTSCEIFSAQTFKSSHWEKLQSCPSAKILVRRRRTSNEHCHFPQVGLESREEP